LEPMDFKLLDVEVPTDLSHPEGMQVVFGDREDRYAAFYYPDIEYARYGERGVRLQLIKPAFPKGPMPLIVYIQGSGWLPQQRYAAIPQLSDFAHQGYIVASVEYRHSLEAQFPAQLQDVKAAIRYLRANSEQHGIDPDRVAIWGDSSGGHLSALVGATDGMPEFLNEHYPDQPSHVKAVVDFCGPSDLARFGQAPSKIDHEEAESPASRLVGGKLPDLPDKASEASPTTYIDSGKKLPPFLIMHGDRDEIVPFQQSVILYEKLRDAGQDVTFYKIKGAGHGPGFWNASVIKIVLDFLKANV